MLKTREMVIVAMLISLAVVFELIFESIGLFNVWAYGGSISLAMLPLFIISYHLGFKWGFISGAIYGVINLMLEGKLYHWASLPLDYIFAFGFISVCAIFAKTALKGNILHFTLGIVLGGFVRYLFHSISGILLFSEWFPEGVNPFYYSFILYNGPYMLGSVVLCIIVGLFIYKPLTVILKDKKA